jgi:hypothetical protein
MGLFDKIRGEFIDVIEWTDDSGTRWSIDSSVTATRSRTALS